MKAIIVTCPHCGARLEVAGTLIDVRCEYCGTASRIQKRTRVLERVLPPPPLTDAAPREIAVQRRSALLPVIVGVLVVLVMAPISIVFVKRAGTQRAVHPTTATQSAKPPPGLKPSHWLGTDSAIVADLDGDGALEIIGRARRSDPDGVSILALDFATGTPRWESESLGGYSDVYRHPLALAGNLLVFGSSLGEVRAFSTVDGTPRWTTKLGERVEKFCDGGDHVVALGVDGVERKLALADGAMFAAVAEAPPEPSRSKTPAKAPPCKPLPSDKEEQRWNLTDRDLARPHDLDFDRLRIGPSGRVLSGQRRKGTHVPTLVAIDDANAARWRVEVPIDPLATDERAPGQVVVGADAVCAVYQPSRSENRLGLTCFAATDGRRLWHEQLSSHYASALVINGSTLLVSMGGVLEARELQTGAVRWRFQR